MENRFASYTRRMTLAILLLPCLSGCDTSSFKANHHFSGEKWPREETVMSKFIPSRTGIYLPSVWIRHTTDYPYRDLHCLLTISRDYVTYLSDTLHLTLATSQGTWLGQGLNGLKTIFHSCSNPVVLDSAECYTITIRQLMKDNPLPAISDAGIVLELQTPND